MKILIKNIKLNEIKLVSGGGLCGCSSEDGLKRSLVMERKDAEECKTTCCRKPTAWEMAHFIDNIEQPKPISMYCTKKSIISLGHFLMHPIIISTKHLLYKINYYLGNQ